MFLLYSKEATCKMNVIVDNDWLRFLPSPINRDVQLDRGLSFTFQHLDSVKKQESGPKALRNPTSFTRPLQRHHSACTSSPRAYFLHTSKNCSTQHQLTPPMPPGAKQVKGTPVEPSGLYHYIEDPTDVLGQRLP